MVISINKFIFNSEIIFIKVTRKGKNKKIEYSLINKTKIKEFKKNIRRKRFFILSERFFPKYLKE